jgi:ABC-type oligopeptide transport system substrate-binding subunit/class 3 adenylate cyclase
MSEREQLIETIAHLETQRATLGDAAVDLSIAALREKLVALEPKSPPEQRKQATVLLADVSGYTAMSETMDAEEVSDVMNALWQRIDAAIVEQGGHIDKHTGDGVMALWGVDTASESDPERAIRAALAMQAALTEFKADHPLQMRIGLSTGPVLLGDVGTTGEFSAIGDTVNLASRMEATAPIGGVLISHDTYLHVRGLFDVSVQQPMLVKGKAEPVQTYVVLRAKARAFHLGRRGIQGVETRMVGRDVEMASLQELLNSAIAGRQTTLVTVVGEAGVGKSRLLYEFDNWLELQPEEVWYFKGRCTQQRQGVANGLLRDLFAFRFGIAESDAIEVVRGKLEAGVARFLPADGEAAAHYLGAWLGYDYGHSPHVAVLGGDAEQLHNRASLYLAQFFAALAEESPVVVLLEDLHWADGGSLNALVDLCRRRPGLPLFILSMARPGLLVRRPGWGSDLLEARYERVELAPLGESEAWALVIEILQRVSVVPPILVELLVSRAEGNPYYVEELVQMLIDQGVIRTQQERWWVVVEKLAELQVPATLTAVLQARLDRLTAAQKEALQQAAVVGRVFWDAVLAELGSAAEDQLGELAGRELVLPRRPSTFAGTAEYIFKHALLRDVTYETVLLKLRRVYHGQVARWLEGAAGERIGEYLGLIAGHYELAGDGQKAVEYLQRAGDQARLAYANQEASAYYRRALALLEQQGEREQAARTLMKLGLTYHAAFDFQQARQAYDEGFALWQRARETEPALPPPPAPHAFRVARLDPPTLDPTIAGGTTSGAIICQLFSGLVDLSPQMNVVPDVAQSWEVLEGGRKYIFHLRDDVYWSDGTPVTAGDFEYAWKRVLDPATGSPVANLLYDIKGARAFHQAKVGRGDVGVRATNDLTLAVELEEPTGYFLSLLSHRATYPVPRCVVEEHGEAWTEKGNIVTNGPFRLEAWQRGQSMVLMRSPVYHGRFTGNVQRVELSLFSSTEWSTVLAMYEADQLDILDLLDLPPLDRDRARREHAGEYVWAPLLSTLYVAFNVSRPPFDDVRVRRAFVLAIDREWLADVVWRGYYSPASGGFVPAGMPGHSTGIGLPYDPEQARTLLAEAGYPGGRAFPTVDALLALHRVGEYLQTQWRENLGLEITWKAMEVGAFLSRLDRDPPNLLLFAWGADYPDPDNFLRVCPARSRAQWRSKAYERLVEEAWHITDQEERLGMYQEADTILVEEAAIMPLLYQRLHLLVKPWVSKYPTSPIRVQFWRDVIIEPH